MMMIDVTPMRVGEMQKI